MDLERAHADTTGGHTTYIGIDLDFSLRGSAQTSCMMRYLGPLSRVLGAVGFGILATNLLQASLTALLKLWNLSTAPELADHAVVNGTKEGLTLPSGSNRVPAAYSETLLKETPTVSASTVLRIGLGSGASSRLPMTGDGLFDKCRGGEMQIASIQS